MTYRAHWIALLIVIVGSFAILGGYGPRIYSGAPPVPAAVLGDDGAVVIDGAAIRRGQNVWQAMGGQEVGSIWGHGAYVAPDWTADWLHREATFMLDRWALDGAGRRYDALAPEAQAALRERLTRQLRENTYDAEARTIRVGPERAAAFEANAAHYADVFGIGRDAYAIPPGTIRDPARARDLAAFFWWTSWAR